MEREVLSRETETLKSGTSGTEKYNKKNKKFSRRGLNSRMQRKEKRISELDDK